MGDYFVFRLNVVRFSIALILVLSILTGCNQRSSLSSTSTASPIPLELTSTSNEPEKVENRATQTPVPLPLSQMGQYGTGWIKFYKYHDDLRDRKEVSVSFWYPTSLPDGADRLEPIINAEPDPSGGPYPLIISSTKQARNFAPYVVPHGFIWASVDNIDTNDFYTIDMIEQPRDLLFALQQVTEKPPPELEGIIDAENIGVNGYSFDGYNTFALSGARINPDFFLGMCSNPPNNPEVWFDPDFHCPFAENWSEFERLAGPEITQSEDGLWKPITDPRIKAVVPMAGDGWWLFGEQGISAIDIPVMILIDSEDIVFDENKLIFNTINSTDKAMITFVGQTHSMVYHKEQVARMAHFLIAFFGYHLQGKTAMKEYYSKEFVSEISDLEWEENNR